jgi:hypothetical protein
VASGNGRVAGMFGLEPAGLDAMELRRMYVAQAAPGARHRKADAALCRGRVPASQDS